MYLSTALIFLLTVLDILVYYLQKQEEEDDDEQENSSLSSSLDQQSIHEGDHGEKKDPSTSSLPDKQCQRFSLAEIKLATHDFDDALVIGKGGFGKVYKGKIDVGNGIDVAIKRSNLDSNQGATEFWAEIEMLSKIRHSHIVSLLGYCEESGTREMILVYEYLPNGSLEDHLHKRRASGSPLTWVQRLHVCIGAARGLDYLHTGTGVQCRVIHRDVKSSNILLDENWTGKISDFGLSRIGPAYQSGSTTHVYTGLIRGTFGYMDAEYFLTHRLTRKSDVYAFGVVLLEVLCGRPALDFKLDEQQHSLAGWAKYCIKEGNIGRIIDPCLRGQVSANCMKEFGKIAYKCLHSCSKDRPTMTMVLARLEFVLAWTLASVQRASNRKHMGRSMFISMFLTKPTIPMSSDRKKLGQSIGNKKKGIMMEKHVTTMVEEGGRHNDGIATASRKVVPPSGQIMIPILKIFTFSELRKATRNFRLDRVIGWGAFGMVFKGWLDSITYTPREAGDRLAVAIKKLNPKSVQGLEEWQAEVELWGKFSHRNLVKLLGYCRENKELLLVYEFMQKGSLENQLFKKGGEPLTWDTRIKIAIGAAQGLAFLHTTENIVIFSDMKPSHILLDEDFNVKLSDFGLAKVGPVDGESYVSTRVVGIATAHLYIKSDVYGFGVVMLAIIAGLRVLDLKRQGVNLLDWAKPFLSDKKRLQEIMDPRLEQDYPTKGAHKAVGLILTCLDPNPKNRPSMEEVVSTLQGINAIKMKLSQSKSKSNTRYSSNFLGPNQNHQ